MRTTYRGLRTFLSCAVLSGFLLATPTRATIRYTISLDHPEEHLFHVTMEIPNSSGETTVQMAAWNALYQIRDFSAQVQDVKAYVGNEAASLAKVDKQTWRVRGSGTVVVKYSTYWNEAGPFSSQLNTEHAFINPAMVLMYVPERRAEDVRITMPDVPTGWQAISATATSDKTMGGVRVFAFMANSFDAAADSPIEAGKFESFGVPGTNPPIWVAVHGEGWKKKEIEDELKKICSYELKLMDGAPFERYTFILHIGRDAGGGGMEHSNSTAISVGSAQGLAGVAAHEFFHLWNVKRIRPATLYPVDYTKEQFTRALWFAEGVTSTYGSYTLLRAGIWNKDNWYADLSEQISELESRPANHWQSAEQSSLDAWLEKYPVYNRPQDSVSYYTKGQILGVLLDILIRDRTGNQKSLDDVMRSMNADFAKTGKAYRDSLDVRLTAEKVAGGSFEDFFRKYVAGAEPLPYQEVLKMAGLELQTVERKRAALGFSVERNGEGLQVVRSVDADSDAMRAGLKVGDVISNWNGASAPRNAERWLRSQVPGGVLRLSIRRDNKDTALEMRLAEKTETFYEVAEDSHACEKARRVREGLLQGETQAGPVH